MSPFNIHDEIIGGHVDALNNSEKVFWESDIFAFVFGTPTLPSNHVSANQEYMKADNHRSRAVTQAVARKPFKKKFRA